jgi:hypothetical protein
MAAAWVHINETGEYINLSQIVTASVIETDSPPNGGLITIKDANGQTHYKSNNGVAYASKVAAQTALDSAITGTLGGSI